MNETPIVPKSVSVVANTQQARPNTRFEIGKLDSNPVSTGPGRDNSGSGSNETTLAVTEPQVKLPPVPKPPPVISKPPKPEPPRSLGVVNGIAKDLPKPNYPAVARAANIQGKVDVQVLIDETGKVISAKAVNGPPMLQDAAERAARNARFSPTLLSNVPVKVTGLIVYNFSRG